MQLTPIGDVYVNGVAAPSAMIAWNVADVGLLRGYGCFEAMRCYGGVPFRMGDHLDRLAASAAALRLPLPDRAGLEAWVRACAGSGDVTVRVVVTGGVDIDQPGVGSQVIVFAHALAAPVASVRVMAVTAPWHPAGAPSQLTGVKSLSYAPNAAAQVEAKRHGFDDAMLLSRDGVVLELPMSSVAWVIDGDVETPSLDLGILRSVTRAGMLDTADEAGIQVIEGRYDLARVLAADEVFVMSTGKEIAPVVAVGAVGFEPGPVTSILQHGFSAMVEREIGAGV